MNRNEALDLALTVARCEAEVRDWDVKLTTVPGVIWLTQLGNPTEPMATIEVVCCSQRDDFAVRLDYGRFVDADCNWLFTSADTSFPV